MRGSGRIQYLFALSRTPHALLDLAAPALTAVLWINRIPDLRVIIIGIVTSFAAYTAVYALNDIIDFRRDQRRIAAGCPDPDGDLDASLMLHPLALECLSVRDAVLWTIGWGVVALTGAYLLNPVCALIFLGACVLETAYCILGDVTPARTFIAGIVKSAGPLAAILAVDPAPETGRFILFFSWLFLWEVGGQNIPNDWADVHEDRNAGLRTVAVALRPRPAALLTLGALLGTVTLSSQLSLPGESATFHLGYVAAVLLAGALLLLVPAARILPAAWTADHADGGADAAAAPVALWARSPLRRSVLSLFNRASYYPFSLVLITALRLGLEWKIGR